MDEARDIWHGTGEFTLNRISERHAERLNAIDRGESEALDAMEATKDVAALLIAISALRPDQVAGIEGTLPVAPRLWDENFS